MSEELKPCSLGCATECVADRHGVPSECLSLKWRASLLAKQHGRAPDAQPEPAAPTVVEPLKGWKLNHVQFVRGSGKAEIGYLDPEDDRFAPIVTVDTGLYYEPNQAHPLAIAILGALQAATPPRAALTVEEAAAIAELLKTDHDGSDFEPECPLCTAYRKLIGAPRNE